MQQGATEIDVQHAHKDEVVHQSAAADILLQLFWQVTPATYNKQFGVWPENGDYILGPQWLNTIN